MATVVSLINMKGGVGKTTLAFNFAWYAAWARDMNVLAIDLDPQANLSQYMLGANGYLSHLAREQSTVVDIFGRFCRPKTDAGAARDLDPSEVILRVRDWGQRGCIYLVASKLELALQVMTRAIRSAHLAEFLEGIADHYDLVIIDCPPTESVLTMAAYRASQYVVVPVKPQFLATIGIPLLARSLGDYRLQHPSHDIRLAGIVFNGGRRENGPPDQDQAYRDVKADVVKYGWPLFANEAYHSDSYAAGSRSALPIFHTNYARDYVINEFNKVGDEFLKRVGLA
jgi:chromosome partitioning protein